jgi:hypothetical protein
MVGYRSHTAASSSAHQCRQFCPLCQSPFGRKFPVHDPCREWIWSGKLFHVLAAERGCPMDNNDSMQGDVPAQVALMVFVSLWGILSYSAILSMARIWA